MRTSAPDSLRRTTRLGGWKVERKGRGGVGGGGTASRDGEGEEGDGGEEFGLGVKVQELYVRVGGSKRKIDSGRLRLMVKAMGVCVCVCVCVCVSVCMHAEED